MENSAFILQIAMILAIMAVVSNSKIFANHKRTTHSLFLPRSQGLDTAHWLTGYTQVLPSCNETADVLNKLLIEYDRSFRDDQIAKYLFGTTCLNFAGSEAKNRKPTDILADNFGLPTTYKGKICFKPRIVNIQGAITYRLFLENWLHGLYFEINAPIVVSRTNLGIKEKSSKKPHIALFPEGYMSVKKAKTAKSICQAISGKFLFGDMKEPWDFGIMAHKTIEKYAIAGLNTFIGWNFLLEEYRHVGAYLLAIAPTGTKIRGRTIFSPIVGNGDLWELALGSTWHYDFINNDKQLLTVGFNGLAGYQFKTDQIRAFDYKNRGRLSRYMLLKKLFYIENTPEELINGIDYTSKAARVGGSFEFDASIKLAYYYTRFGAELGYNIYARTQEDLRLLPDIYPSDLNHQFYGVKGTTGAYYEEDGIFKHLDATESKSTIFKASPIDNPMELAGKTYNGKTVDKSEPPINVTLKDLDLYSGTVPTQLTHKIFTHFSYLNLTAYCEPQIGIGVQMEVNGLNNYASLNHWTVWLDGNLAF